MLNFFKANFLAFIFVTTVRFLFLLCRVRSSLGGCRKKKRKKKRTTSTLLLYESLLRPELRFSAGTIGSQLVRPETRTASVSSWPDNFARAVNRQPGYRAKNS